MTTVPHVPEALRKTLHPRRSIPGSAVPPTAQAARRLLPKIREAVAVKAAFYGEKTHAAIYSAGTKSAAPEVRELHVRALALLSEPSEVALQRAEIDTLAAADVMLHRAAGRLDFLGALVALRGLLDAVRVLHRASRFDLAAASAGWTTAVWLTATPEADHRWTSRWLPVRHAVCAADDASYREAVAVARSLREGADLARRAQLAFVFPDEPWANEDLAASQAPGCGVKCPFLLSAASDVQAVREACRSPHALATYALDLAQVLPPADMLALCAEALPALLKKPKYGPLHKTPPRMVAQAIACFRTEEAAAMLAPYASNAILAPLVLGFFRDAPELADAVAGSAGRAGGRGVAAVQRVVARKALAAESVVSGEAPALLRERPWRRGKASKKARGADELRDVALVGSELGRVVLPRGLRAPVEEHGPLRDMTEEELVAWRKETEEGIAKGGYASADLGLHRVGGRLEYARVPDAECLWAWNTGKASLRGAPLELVRRHGLAAVPGFVRHDWMRWLGEEYYGGSAYLEATMAFDAPEVAPRIARVAARRKKYRRVALGWLHEHAEISALGLIPDAVGAAGEARDDAEAALLFLVARGEAGVVRAAARRYPAAVTERIEQLLARDPLALGVAAPKRPDFLRFDELPPVVLAAGGALDAEALDALVEMLQISALDPPYAGLARVREACDGESLDALAVALLEQWVLGDAPGRHEWMLSAVVHFPSAVGERRVASLAREWARKSQDKAKRACGVLAALGSDLALMHLAQIAETTRFDALKRHAGTLLLEAADARGLSPGELGDRTVPDLGLARDGTLALSYGPRSFVVSLDEALRPLVFEELEGGARSAPARSLPRPTKADDAEAAKLARERFDLFEADLEAVADRERRRLERAMASGRSWTVADFRVRLADHPLLGHLAQRLVWAATTSDGREALFRIAEDRTFADVSDALLQLPEGAVVRIAHPARLAPGVVVAWARLFADYAILQPFEQLGRAAYAIEAKEREAKALSRVAGIVVPARKTLGILESRGFRRESAGYVSAYLRDVRGEDGEALVVRLPLTPGFEIESLAHAPNQTTGPATLAGPDGAEVAFGALDAVAFSELVRDALALSPS